jgi:TrbC/VIRB2 pilin
VNLFIKNWRRCPLFRTIVLLPLFALLSLAQDPFSAIGQSATTISTGQFATGLILLAIVVAGVTMCFAGRVMGGVLVAVIAGGMLALSATKWQSWIQGL